MRDAGVRVVGHLRPLRSLLLRWAIRPYTQGVKVKGGYGRGDNGIRGFWRTALEVSARSYPLTVSCSGVRGRETGGLMAFDSVVVPCIKPPIRSSKQLGSAGRCARSGEDSCGPTGGFEGEIVQSRAALLGFRHGGDVPRGLRSKAAQENLVRARVAVLQESRRERYRGVRLAWGGRGLYWANGRYLVYVIFGLFGYRDFERHDGGRERKKEAGVALVGVRRKRLNAAEGAGGEAYRRYHCPDPGRSASASSPVLGARSKACGSKARGGRNP